MDKLTIRLAVVITLLALAATSLVALHAGNSHASHGPTVHPTSVFTLEHQVGKPGGQASPAANLSCGTGAVKGNRVINATEKVINDADSGQAGNYWGLDAFSRTFAVYNTGSDTWCAVVTYTGTFAAQAGQQSPGSSGGNGGILTGDEAGTFKGGYVAQITGPLDVSDPANWPLSGKVNGGSPVDYQCVINPDGSSTCPGFVDWTTKYFDTSNPGFSFNEDPWGWTYTGHDCCAPDKGTPDGVWRNFSTGNSGDILDVD